MWIVRSVFLLTVLVGVLSPDVALGQKELEIRLAEEYYRNGDLEKARTIYENLAKNYEYIPNIHNNYFSLLLDLKDFKAADRYLNNVVKRYPSNLYYVLDRGIIFRERGELDNMDHFYTSLIKGEIREDNYKTRVAAQYFINRQLVEYSILTYKEARAFVGTSSVYAFELANIYRYLNRKELMVEEYLNYLEINPSNLNYVRNTLQTVLTEQEDLDQLETLLHQKIQSEPGNVIYNELLIWVNLQRKNFSGAFVQARALDRRKGTGGDRAMNIGMIAAENGDYNSAVRIFDYIIQQYPESNNSILARHYRIKAEEELVKNTFPVDEEKIRELISKYQDFIQEVGFVSTTLEAYRNEALLYAFYLDEKEIASSILQEIIDNPRTSRELRARSKLDLGDIFLLTGEPWESALLYSQVEKSMKQTQVGYEAKLRNARLSYFKGEFKLAQEHLDILKEATTREISNDAMQLSLLIRDNTGLDSTETAMREYAEIELLLFQNKTDAAKQDIDRMIREYPAHSLHDELLWLKADIYRKEGNFEQALSHLEQISTSYGTDILGDDAYYLMGVMNEQDLQNVDRAMEIYQDFLVKYPGSVYIADVRKRYRTLRGDFETLPEPVN